MKILTLSDVELGFIYSPMVVQRFKDCDLIISCGDLPYFYLEYVISMLNVPLYFVRGNHANQEEHSAGGSSKRAPDGGIDLNQQSRSYKGLLMAGIEGSLQYNYGPFQYSQTEMWLKVYSLVTDLLINRIRFGRWLDIFVTHAPPWKIHDQDDRPHQGIKAFRWFDKVIQPKIHLHGHIHVYRNDVVTSTVFYNTTVINSYGYKELDFDLPYKTTSLFRKNIQAR